MLRLVRRAGDLGEDVANLRFELGIWGVGSSSHLHDGVWLFVFIHLFL